MANSGGWAVRAGWVAVIIGPPAVAAALLRHLVAAHFATAVVLGLVYEGVVGGSRFVGGVVGELATRWRERLVERIDLMLQQKVSGFGLRYREFVLADVRFIDQRDLSTVGYFTPELDEVFEHC